jgi:hypothetical protein
MALRVWTNSGTRLSVSCRVRTRSRPPRAYEHPARAADLLWKGERVGRVFELHPSLVETGRAAVLDLDLDRVRALCRR